MPCENPRAAPGLRIRAVSGRRFRFSRGGADPLGPTRRDARRRTLHRTGKHLGAQGRAEGERIELTQIPEAS